MVERDMLKGTNPYLDCKAFLVNFCKGSYLLNTTVNSVRSIVFMVAFYGPVILEE